MLKMSFILPHSDITLTLPARSTVDLTSENAGNGRSHVCKKCRIRSPTPIFFFFFCEIQLKYKALEMP